MSGTPVLVADDDAEVTDLISRVLTQKGFVVYSAREGWSALETALKVRPAVVLLDIRMPLVQGCEVCRYLKDRSEMRDTKVVLMSGLIKWDNDQLAMRCGADGTLPKPFEIDELVEKVSLLSKRKNGKGAMPLS